jgi:hypothetical protein
MNLHPLAEETETNVPFKMLPLLFSLMPVKRQFRIVQ